MQQNFSSLALELLAHGYRSFSTHQMYCPHHGLLRLNLEFADERWPCPACHQERVLSRPIAHGITKQPLPSFDVIVGPCRWNWIAKRDFVEEPQPQGSRARHSPTERMIRQAKAELALGWQLSPDGTLARRRKITDQQPAPIAPQVKASPAAS
jgi:hypothetical protein